MFEKYWTQEDRDALDLAGSYGDLFAIAERILHRIPRPRGQMCGPITTGGAGSVEANLKRFEIAFEHAMEQGIEIFDQLPFELSMQRIKAIVEPSSEYPVRLLSEFYGPIFENKLVDTLFFLPDWQTSRGASWEHEQATRVGLEVVYLPENLFRRE